MTLQLSKKGKDGHAHMLHGMAAADTIAWVMYQKFCNSLPYTRQVKRLGTVRCCYHKSNDGKLGNPQYIGLFHPNV